ncbi:uncharacterized histidine-rich protein DDB_G0274557-like [Teleopsis dalmanni]|uniref:uncharacterized histidine-rich protein DDB_G0274557-like n=1 Tax=Teleopsis dalmanni TaxID=139649 RepID=UPI0018CF6F38|nr:uncharacterized histidine-rich protein DDB_G0274557-like [Teleopsis dalmanni]
MQSQAKGKRQLELGVFGHHELECQQPNGCLYDPGHNNQNNDNEPDYNINGGQVAQLQDINTHTPTAGVYGQHLQLFYPNSDSAHQPRVQLVYYNHPTAIESTHAQQNYGHALQLQPVQFIQPNHQQNHHHHQEHPQPQPLTHSQHGLQYYQQSHEEPQHYPPYHHAQHQHPQPHPQHHQYIAHQQQNLANTAPHRFPETEQLNTEDVNPNHYAQQHTSTQHYAPIYNSPQFDIGHQYSHYPQSYLPQNSHFQPVIPQGRYAQHFQAPFKPSLFVGYTDDENYSQTSKRAASPKNFKHKQEPNISKNYQGYLKPVHEVRREHASQQNDQAKRQHGKDRVVYMSPVNNYALYKN